MLEIRFYLEPKIRGWRMKGGEHLAIWNECRQRWQIIELDPDLDPPLIQLCKYSNMYFPITVVGDVTRGIIWDLRRKSPLGPEEAEWDAKLRKQAREEAKKREAENDLKSRIKGRLFNREP